MSTGEQHPARVACVRFDCRNRIRFALYKIPAGRYDRYSKNRWRQELRKYMDEQNREQEKHVRRVHYSGTHPKHYAEKYKEHHPEKYGDTIEKVIRKGSTPAGMHIPIMVPEILEVLQIRPGEQGLDATLGYGGHTLKMMECMDHRGSMHATDVDPIESAKTRERLKNLGYGEDFLHVHLRNFAEVGELAREVGTFDFVLADLGVSSMQIDNPERGFSYKLDGPLDLRLDPTKGISAAERLQTVGLEELAGMLRENSDEPYAAQIAANIIRKRKQGVRIDTTTALRHIIEETLARLPAAERPEAVKKTSARVFQALRIDVNQEFEVLYAFLNILPEAVSSGGRIAILTFHSGEDKLVKKAFKEGLRSGVYSRIAEDVIRPSAEECARNPRARSTKLRWAVRA